MPTLKNKCKTGTQELNRHEIKYLKKEQWLRLIESIDNYRGKLIVKLLYSNLVLVQVRET